MKRFFDLSMSLLALIALSPLLLFLYILIAVKMGRPVIFVQTRPGIKGKAFDMMKFRSMSDEKDVHGKLLPDEQRLPAFGQFLRSSSLDELPGLINVLRGEMSLVGPRPLLMEYLPLYSAEQIRRHDVHPGITGWAQVNGRNTLSWEKKFEYDVWYVDNQSFWLDIKILFMTVLKVVRRADINQQGEATMTRFTGSETMQKSDE